MRYAVRAIALVLVCVMILPAFALADTMTVYIAANTLKVYAANSTSSKVLGVMSYGESLTLLAYQSGWARVRNGDGDVGYCETAGLSKTDPNQYAIAVYAVAALRVYAKPDTTSKLLGTMDAGDSMTCVAVTSDDVWCRVKLDGKVGYAQKNGLSTSKPESGGDVIEVAPSTLVVYVASNTLTVYQTNSTSSRSLGVMCYGDSMTLLAEKNGWAQVKNSAGKVGYCDSKSLTRDNPSTLDVTVYVTTAAGVYAKPIATAKVVKTAAKGDSFLCVGATGDGVWCRVAVGSSYGYIEKAKLDLTPAGDEQEPETDTEKIVHVSSNTLTVYQTNSTSSRSLGVMCYGDSMTLLAEKDGWAQVKNSAGKIGYCDADGIVEDASFAFPLMKIMDVLKSGTVFYAKPLTTAKKISVLNAGDEVLCVGKTGDGLWCRVEVNNVYGFIESSCLADHTDDDEEQTVTPVLQTTPVYIAANTAKVYASASTSSRSLGTMSYGETLSMTTYKGDWAEVMNASGSKGYCRISLLTKTDPNKLDTTVYASASGVKVYAKPIETAKQLGALSANESIKCVAVTSDGSWCRVEYSGGYGYVKKSLLASKPYSGNTKVYAEDTQVSVYAENTTSSELLGVLSFGESTTMLAYSDGWALVNIGLETGYCKTDGLTKTDPNSIKKTCYAQSEGVSVRVAPTSTAVEMESLSVNETCTVVMISADSVWCRVKTSNGYGYVKKSDLDTEKVASSSMFITETTLKVYDTPNEYGKVLGTMSYGESLLMISESGGWAYVENSSGNKGYCILAGLSGTNPNKYDKTGYARTDGIIVYSKPLTSSSVLAKLSVNSTVLVIAMTKDESWCRVKNGSVYGYIQSSGLSTSRVEIPGENDGGDDTGYNQSMDSLLTLARSKLGCSYVYATQGPNTFDCSGFTNYLYRTIYNITLSRSAYGQGYQTKYQVIGSLDDLKPGDVLCFNTNTSDDDMSDHVALYLGNGQFIHASYTAGKVIISNFTNYYKSVFYHAFRPVG